MLSTLHEFSPFLSFTFFCFGHAEYGILVAQPGIELMPAAVEAWNLNLCHQKNPWIFSFNPHNKSIMYISLIPI